jgi:poly-gamma-glutamate capsule biosynthesis protein CapA/YwtB (metallophosphatase superfamily)
MNDAITIMAVGDLILDEPNPDWYFEPSAALLRSADLAIGQIDVPHSTSNQVTAIDVPAPPADPAHLAAVANAGISVITLAGNHVYDAGAQGVHDTLSFSRAAGLSTAGAGMTLDEAREPAIVERGGWRIGVLSFNCIGPRESWATSKKPGSAYVQILTHHELSGGTPGGPIASYTFCEPSSLARMSEDIVRLRASVDVVIVAFHKGVAHIPAEIADYEYEIAHAAVDAGADAVFSHYAHIMRGVEFYRDRPIFHGLGNFVTATRALEPSGGSSDERAEWARRRRARFGFSQDPNTPTYPFHPEGRNAAIAVLRLGADAEISTSLIPCWIDDDARPHPLTEDRAGMKVASYIESITRESEFDTTFAWSNGELVLTAGDSGGGSR